MKQSNVKIVYMPIPYHKPGWDETPFLEGGDVFVLGRDIYVGCSGNASSELPQLIYELRRARQL